MVPLTLWAGMASARLRSRGMAAAPRDADPISFGKFRRSVVCMRRRLARRCCGSVSGVRSFGNSRYSDRMPVSKTDLPLLADVDVLASLRALREKQPVKFAAFYSSQLGGVVTDPALMVIPFDDHIVHRGHGIFDTAGVVNGRIYDLEAHLDRFVRSAERSKLALAGSRAEMR